MTTSLNETIRRHCQALDPIPTGEQPVLNTLDGVRAVIFDVYGTLLISASGDIDASPEVARGQAVVEALEAIGIRWQGNAEDGTQFLADEIAAEHRRGQQAGIEYPEVDIVDMWRRALVKMNAAGLIENLTGSGQDASALAGLSDLELSDIDLQQLALEYELRVNPVWPMPNARQCLKQLHAAGLLLGIISNAQFLTITLWRELLGADSCGFEFDPQLQYYSYQHGQAKPGLHLYQQAAEALAGRGIRAGEVLYVGNDLLKDVMPAGVVGFRTALFAGDGRSLRRREGDPRIAGVIPDLVITDLSDVQQCIR